MNWLRGLDDESKVNSVVFYKALAEGFMAAKRTG
jgi:hypothetical protein